jgi:hypothetical protein
MKKVITFSLWGDNPTYNIGAIKNAEHAKIFYPDFECWFYIHEESVPKETIEKLNSFNNTKIIFKNGDLNIIKPMMWRFEAIDEDDVEIMMSRDTDTRFLLREQLAVEEWINSNKLFHIMRDHPYHDVHILGGMFGTKKIPQINSWKNIMNTVIQYSNRNYDQQFLSDYIYPVVKNNSKIHASFCKMENNSEDFPIVYDNEFRFIGEYVYYDESRCQEHINLLKNSL